MPFEVTKKDRQTCSVWCHLDRKTIGWMVKHQNDIGLAPEIRADIHQASDSAVEYADSNIVNYVNRARDENYQEGEVEIDENALVSTGDDFGAYVSAWVWVQDSIPEQINAQEEA